METFDDDLLWVEVPGNKGWVREHDPATQSGIAPRGKYRSEKQKRVSGNAE